MVKYVALRCVVEGGERDRRGQPCVPNEWLPRPAALTCIDGAGRRLRGYSVFPARAEAATIGE
jgi:hypothetical protein